jgi:hypothetical protein
VIERNAAGQLRSAGHSPDDKLVDACIGIEALLGNDHIEIA